MRTEIRIACECRRIARANKRRDEKDERLDLLQGLAIQGITPAAGRMLCAVVRELRRDGQVTARAKRELNVLLSRSKGAR